VAGGKAVDVAEGRADEPLTYGSYLRVPELLDLQTPLADPQVPDEMLFVIAQQAQELWFKQILHDVRRVIEMIDADSLVEAVALVDRCGRVLTLLAAETEVLETLRPAAFHAFRGFLRAASGFESQQFRELEIASGLRERAYLRMAARVIDVDAMLRRWPRSLSHAFSDAVRRNEPEGVLKVLRSPEQAPETYALVESLSDYELRFQGWRFHHIQLVERVIGERSPGTGGSAGTAYLFKTLEYRFFPELWEARNRLTADAVKDRSVG
jgi:tryptophan 2,3-dioxygenase